MLEPLPGSKRQYAGWQSLEQELRSLLAGCRVVAMQYSPRGAVPAVSLVDAGCVEMVRWLGVEVASSGDLLQQFEAAWSEEQLQSHREAGKRIDAIRAAAFRGVSDGRLTHEFEVKSFILEAFERESLFTDHGPIVAVNANASNPHYEPEPATSQPIRTGDVLLIDLWAKLKQPHAVYYDVTWTGFVGGEPPEKVQEVFRVVAGARDGAVRALQEGRAARGFEVDDAARSYIAERGYGDYFIHRTGHSIGEDVHGAGANMDNLETHDDRRLLPHTCFSIEPGIYLPEFGIRSEVNVFMGPHGAEVTGEIQRELVRV
jgi:Xaa-Pro aminopeptidase